MKPQLSIGSEAAAEEIGANGMVEGSVATGVIKRQKMNGYFCLPFFYSGDIVMNFSFLKRSFIHRVAISTLCLFIFSIQAGCQGCYGLGITDLVGIVVDENGHTIEGAKVILRGKPLEIGGIDYIEDTDKDGIFEIQFGHQPGIVIHDVEINVTKDGYDDYTQTMEILDPHPRIVMKKKDNRSHK